MRSVQICMGSVALPCMANLKPKTPLSVRLSPATLMVVMPDVLMVAEPPPPQPARTRAVPSALGAYFQFFIQLFLVFDGW